MKQFQFDNSTRLAEISNNKRPFFNLNYASIEEFNNQINYKKCTFTYTAGFVCISSPWKQLNHMLNNRHRTEFFAIELQSKRPYDYRKKHEKRSIKP